MCLHIVHKTATESLHEFDAGVVGIHREIDVVVLGRNKPFDDGFAVRLLILGNGIDVDLSVLVVIGGVGMQRSHPATLEQEVVDIQLCVCGGVGEDVLDVCFSCGIACKLNTVEVDEVQDIAHINVFQVDHHGVVGIVCRHTVDDDMLFVMVDLEMVDGQVACRVDDVTGLYLPDGVADGNLRRVEDDVCCVLAAFCLEELRVGIDFAPYVFLAAIVERQFGCQQVVLCDGVGIDVYLCTLGANLLELQVGMQHVVGGVQQKVYVLIFSVVIGKCGCVDLHAHTLFLVVDNPFDMCLLRQREWQVEENIQPVRPVDIGIDGKVVACRRNVLGQTWKGRELRGDETCETVGQRLEVVLSVDRQASEVALHLHQMGVVVVACLHRQVVESIVFLAATHVESSDVECSSGVVDSAACDVACDVHIKDATFPLTGQIHRRRVEMLDICLDEIVVVACRDDTVEINLSVRVVDGEQSVILSVLIGAVNVYVAEVVAVVVETADNAFGCDDRRCPQFSVCLNVGNELSQPVVVEYPLQVDTCCFQ